MEKFSYPSHPVRCIITGPSDCGKSVFRTNLFSNNLRNMIKYFYTHHLYIKIYFKD